MNNTMISDKTNPTLEQINQEHQEYLDSLNLIEKKLKLLPEFNKDQIDELISILSITEKKLPINQ